MSQREDHLDPRVQRTRALLRGALRELVIEQDFDSLTIGEITDRATLNRATFYLHYTDKQELLSDVLDEMIGEIVPPPPADGEEASPGRPREIIEALFAHVVLHADFYRVMLGESGVPSFMARVQHYIETRALGWLIALHRQNDDPPVDPAVATQFVSSAFVGVLAWWLENDMPHPTEEMINQLIVLTSGGLQEALGRSPISG